MMSISTFRIDVVRGGVVLRLPMLLRHQADGRARLPPVRIVKRELRDRDIIFGGGHRPAPSPEHRYRVAPQLRLEAAQGGNACRQRPPHDVSGPLQLAATPPI